MNPQYFSLRQLNPYRGVQQVIDLDGSRAFSRDGLIWHIKADDASGQIAQIGIWQSGRGLLAGSMQRVQALIEVIESHPRLPFAFRDSWEFWLLDQEQGLPLALLASATHQPDSRQTHDLEWHPFVPGYTGFSSLLLVERDALTPYATQNHSDVLARLVNRVARPMPRAQWFQRDQAGAGVGGAGVRLPLEWRDRRLEAEQFPRLLVREAWNSRLETSVIADYHAHLSALLLLWPRLDDETRSGLELLACERPQWLARVQRLLAVQMHPQQLRAAWVAARLSQAAGEDEKPWIED